MKHSIVYTPEEDYIALTIQGMADLGSMPNIMSALANQINETTCFDILINVYGAETKMSLLDLLTLIGMIESLAVVHSIELRSLRCAMVARRSPGMVEVREKLEYYLAGEFRIFYSLEEAKTWLKSLSVI